MRKTLYAIFLAIGLSVPTVGAENDITGGINLVNSVSGAQGAETEFLSPVVFWDSYFNIGSHLGLGAGVGFTYTVTNDSKFGWGWLYQDPEAGNYIMPVYGSIKVKFWGTPSMQPYAKLNLGYAFWWADDPVDFPNDRVVYDCGTEGGFYFGLGFGLKMGILTFEMDYSNFTGNIYTDYRYSGYPNYYNPEVDFNFLNIRAGFSF